MMSTTRNITKKTVKIFNSFFKNDVIKYLSIRRKFILNNLSNSFLFFI